MTWKNRLVHIFVVLIIVIFSNFYKGKFIEIGSAGCHYPSEWNFIYIVLMFLLMQIMSLGVSGKINLLILYGLMLINLPFQFLLVSEGTLLAKFIYLTIGALSIWFLYIPFFEEKNRSHQATKGH